MSSDIRLAELLRLPPDERLAIAAAIWDSLVATPDAVPVPDWHRDILDARLDEEQSSNAPGETWPDLRRRIEGRKQDR